MNFWYTADHHFGHERIIEYCKRPFKSIEHMNMELIRRWNERVDDSDVVYHLGDLAFWKVLRPKDFLDQLNGQVIVIKGNHDSRSKVRSLVTSMTINQGGLDIFLSHMPMAVYKLNFCGHVHEKWKIKRHGPSVIVNVGVDVWDFYPITINEILKFLSSEGIKMEPGGDTL